MSLNVLGYLNLNISIMLKNILNLKGAQQLGKEQQKTIYGGDACHPFLHAGYGKCPTGNGTCYTQVPCGTPCPNGQDPIC